MFSSNSFASKTMIENYFPPESYSQEKRNTASYQFCLAGLGLPGCNMVRVFGNKRRGFLLLF